MNNKHWLRKKPYELTKAEEVKFMVFCIAIIAVTTYMIPIILPRTPMNACKPDERTIATRLTVHCVKP